jgi:hypothetical protein
MKMKSEGDAAWTCSDESGYLWYFSLKERRAPPYRNQRQVTAILDIAEDGTLAGVELIHDMPPPPSS